MLAKTKIAKLSLFAMICVVTGFAVMSYLTKEGQTNWSPAIISAALVCCSYALMAKGILSKH